MNRLIKEAKILAFMKKMLSQMDIPLQQRKFGFTIDIEIEIIMQLSKLSEKELDNIIFEAYTFKAGIISNVK